MHLTNAKNIYNCVLPPREMHYTKERLIVCSRAPFVTQNTSCQKAVIAFSFFCCCEKKDLNIVSLLCFQKGFFFFRLRFDLFGLFTL